MVVTMNVPDTPVVNVVAAGAGDGRRLGRLVDRQREALSGVGEHAVGGGEGQRVGRQPPSWCR